MVSWLVFFDLLGIPGICRGFFPRRRFPTRWISSCSPWPGRKALGPRYIEFHPTLPIAYVVWEPWMQGVRHTVNCKLWRVIRSSFRKTDSHTEKTPNLVAVLQNASLWLPGICMQLDTTLQASHMNLDTVKPWAQLQGQRACFGHIRLWIWHGCCRGDDRPWALLETGELGSFLSLSCWFLSGQFLFFGWR